MPSSRPLRPQGPKFALSMAPRDVQRLSSTPTSPMRTHVAAPSALQQCAPSASSSSPLPVIVSKPVCVAASHANDGGGGRLAGPPSPASRASSFSAAMLGHESLLSGGVTTTGFSGSSDRASSCDFDTSDADEKAETRRQQDGAAGCTDNCVVCGGGGGGGGRCGPRADDGSGENGSRITSDTAASCAAILAPTAAALEAIAATPTFSDTSSQLSPLAPPAEGCTASSLESLRVVKTCAYGSDAGDNSASSRGRPTATVPWASTAAAAGGGASATSAATIRCFNSASSADGPSQIAEHVFLGTEADAADVAGLQELGVRRILNVAAECTVPSVVEREFEVLHVPLRDHSDENIASSFAQCARFIRDGVERGEGVLVHCRMGVSRSATVVLAYLMLHGTDARERRVMRYGEALDHVKARRPQVSPNLGFVLSLRKLDEDRGLAGADDDQDDDEYLFSASPSCAASFLPWLQTPREPAAAAVVMAAC